MLKEFKSVKLPDGKHWMNTIIMYTTASKVFAAVSLHLNWWMSICILWMYFKISNTVSFVCSPLKGGTEACLTAGVFTQAVAARIFLRLCRQEGYAAIFHQVDFPLHYLTASFHKFCRNIGIFKTSALLWIVLNLVNTLKKAGRLNRLCFHWQAD